MIYSLNFILYPHDLAYYIFIFVIISQLEEALKIGLYVNSSILHTMFVNAHLLHKFRLDHVANASLTDLVIGFDRDAEMEEEVATMKEKYSKSFCNDFFLERNLTLKSTLTRAKYDKRIMLTWGLLLLHMAIKHGIPIESWTNFDETPMFGDTPIEKNRAGPGENSKVATSSYCKARMTVLLGVNGNGDKVIPTAILRGKQMTGRTLRFRAQLPSGEPDLGRNIAMELVEEGISATPANSTPATATSDRNNKRPRQLSSDNTDTTSTSSATVSIGAVPTQSSASLDGDNSGETKSNPADVSFFVRIKQLLTGIQLTESSTVVRDIGEDDDGYKLSNVETKKGIVYFNDAIDAGTMNELTTATIRIYNDHLKSEAATTGRRARTVGKVPTIEKLDTKSVMYSCFLKALVERHNDPLCVDLFNELQAQNKSEEIDEEAFGVFFENNYGKLLRYLNINPSDFAVYFKLKTDLEAANLISEMLEHEIITTYSTKKRDQQVVKCLEVDVTDHENAWVDSNIFHRAILRTLLKNRESNNSPFLVMMDNFKAHDQPEVIQDILNHGGIVLMSPPYSTSLFQPLDLRINAIFKQILKEIHYKIHNYRILVAPKLNHWFKPDWQLFLVAYVWSRISSTAIFSAYQQMFNNLKLEVRNIRDELLK